MRRLLSLLFLASSISLFAQNDDFGLDFSVGAQKEIVKGLDISAEANVRTQNNTKDIERYSFGASVGYKVVNTKKFDLKLSAGWQYIRQRTLCVEDTTRKGNKKITSAYWRNRHRTSVEIGGRFKPDKRWTLSLKESFQYNHYGKVSLVETKYDKYFGPEGAYYDYDDPDIEQKTKGPKDRFVLRSKLSVEYDIKHSPFSPYVSCDYGCGLNYSANKWKFSAGTGISLSRNHGLDIYYRFQTENDDDEPNGHIIGVGYKFKF